MLKEWVRINEYDTTAVSFPLLPISPHVPLLSAGRSGFFLNAHSGKEFVFGGKEAVKHLYMCRLTYIILAKGCG